MKKALASIVLISIILAAAVMAWAQFPKYIYGTVSWYGEEFRGRQTADGEIFDPDQYTAAHRTLPFGTMLEVENMDNGKKVTVRVNDRGPLVDTRVLDVTKKAADELGFSKKGTAYVRITLVKLGDNQIVEEVRNPISNTNTIPAALRSSASAAFSSSAGSAASAASAAAASAGATNTASASAVSSGVAGNAGSAAAVASSFAASSAPYIGTVIVTNELQPLTNYSLLTNYVIVRREFVATNQVFVTNTVQVEVTNVIGIPAYTDVIIERDVTGDATNQSNRYLVDEPKEEHIIAPVVSNRNFEEEGITVTNFLTMTNWIDLTNGNASNPGDTNVPSLEEITNPETPSGTNSALPGDTNSSGRRNVKTNDQVTKRPPATNLDAGNFILAEPDNDTNYAFLQDGSVVTPEVLLADETAFSAESNSIRNEALSESTNVPYIEIPRPESNIVYQPVTNFVTNTMLRPTTNYVYSNIVITAISNVRIPVIVGMSNASAPTNAVPAVVTNVPLPAGKGNWAVQVGAFSDTKRALVLYDVLKHKGYQVFTSETEVKGKKYMRVRMGYYPSSHDAALAAEKLKELKLTGLLVQVQ